MEDVEYAEKTLEEAGRAGGGKHDDEQLFGMASIGPAVANHLWQSTAFAAGGWLLTLALRRNQARVRYCVWLAASVKFLVPFSLLIAAGNLLPHAEAGGCAGGVLGDGCGGSSRLRRCSRCRWCADHVPTSARALDALAAGGRWLCVWLLGCGRRCWRCGDALAAVSATLRRRCDACYGRARGGDAAADGARGGDDSAPIALLLSRERMEPGIFGVLRPVLVWPEEISRGWTTRIWRRCWRMRWRMCGGATT